jgi:hypothetical protein
MCNLHRSSSTEATFFSFGQSSSMESSDYILQQPGFPLIWTAFALYIQGSRGLRFPLRDI